MVLLTEAAPPLGATLAPLQPPLQLADPWVEGASTMFAPKCLTGSSLHALQDHAEHLTTNA